MVISALHKTGPEHITVILEDGTEIQATLGVVTDLRLFTGKDLDVKELSQLRQHAVVALATEKAIALLSYRQMSGKELLSKLKQKGVPAGAAQAAVERLYELRMLDDEAYARAIVRHYANKGYGSARIRMELNRRGIDRDYWDDSLEEAPDNSDKLDRLLRAKLSDPEDRNEVRKATAALFRRGFSWEEIRAALQRIQEESEEY